MRPARSLMSAAASLGLLLVLAACGPGVADAPSPTSPTSPTPPAQSPTESPSAPSGDVIELELPMVARATQDGVEVRARPSEDAPLLSGEEFPDMNRVEIILAADERVAVTLGPLVSEGISWYQVSAVDGGATAFAYGWVSAESLASDVDGPDAFPPMTTAFGVGSGGEISVDVPLPGTPITVDVASAPMDDEDSCDIAVTLVRTDGETVNVATRTLTEPDAFQLGATIEGSVPGLFQDDPGTVTLQIETDCSWAASLTQPPV